MTELWQFSARDLASKIAAGQVTSSETVKAHLARIREVNPRVNAVVKVLEKEALQAAARADEMVAQGEVLGPLHGVPFTAKENIDVGGMPTTWGVPALEKAVAAKDAPVVERMRKAGAILIGRTNLSDMAMRVDTGSSLYGQTLNPWNRERTAGGSSGGEAVAIATGMSPIGLGNDIGGSLRSPANACGIASIRPTNGRVPDAGTVPQENRPLIAQLMNSQGPLARRVADLRLAMEVLNGADPRDPWSVDMPMRLSTSKRPLRVAVAASPFGEHVDPAIVAAVRSAADALASAGYEVTEIVPPRYAEAEDIWVRFLLGDYAAVFEHVAPIMGPAGHAFLKSVKPHIAIPQTTTEMSDLMAERDGIARDWSLFMAEYPLVLTPTWTELPFPIGFDTALPDGGHAARMLVRPMMPANLFGLPSVCVPAGRDMATGLPVGVLVTGARFSDSLCLDCAEVIEASYHLATPIDPVG